MKTTNKTKMSLSLAVWLATDNYDHKADPMHISATGLLRSTRETILSQRAVAQDDLEYDIIDNIPSGMGSAIHTAIEQSWKTNYRGSLKALGYPQSVIDRVIINPLPEQLKKNSIPVYMEQRVSRKMGAYTVSGMYDFVGDGTLEDFKSMGVYGYLKGDSDEKYKLQGSIYRWLNPEIIKADHMLIQCIFTDWSALQATIQKDKGYPPARLLTKKIPLMSLAETEIFISNKLADLTRAREMPEAEIPDCTPADLWRSPASYKYYKNPEKTARSTANFDDYHLAHAKMLKDGNVGIIKEIKGQVKKCNYCKGFTLCTQKDAYLEDGSLTVRP